MRDSEDTSIGLPSSVDNRDAPDVGRRRKGDSSSGFKLEPALRDRYSHNTFCSACKSFRTEEEALAKCAACPRILCRTCAGEEDEEVPRGKNADDIIFTPDKCRCPKRDSEFPKPLRGTDPQAHLLKQLKEHDLAHMFLEPVKVEENPGYLNRITHEDMIDLGTITTKMEKRKQYQSPRGKLMFRRDIKRMWENCWKFAGHTPKSSKEEAAGIVRCTLILEAMVHKFCEAYMEEGELVFDKESWPADQERRHKRKFVMCANPSPTSPTSPASGGGWHDGDGPDEENSRIGATVGPKRKSALDDDGEPPNNAKVSASTTEEGFDRNLCTLAEIGQQLRDSSGKT